MRERLLIFGIIFLCLTACSQMEERRNIFEIMCTSEIELIIPDGKVEVLEPDGKKINIKFNRDLGFGYYVVYDTLTTAFADTVIDFNFIYVLAYNTLHNPNIMLAFIENDKYGFWIGDSAEEEYRDIFNKIISELSINIGSQAEAIDYSLFLLRLLNNGGIEQLYLRSITDVWLLAQYYANIRTNKYIKKFDKINGGFEYGELDSESKYILMQPQKYPDYAGIYQKYNNIIDAPSAKIIDDLFQVDLYIWGHFDGNIEKWTIQFNAKGQINSFSKILIAENIGHFGGWMGILSYPDPIQ